MRIWRQRTTLTSWFSPNGNCEIDKVVLLCKRTLVRSQLCWMVFFFSSQGKADVSKLDQIALILNSPKSRKQMKPSVWDKALMKGLWSKHKDQLILYAPSMATFLREFWACVMPLRSNIFIWFIVSGFNSFNQTSLLICFESISQEKRTAYDNS